MPHDRLQRTREAYQDPVELRLFDAWKAASRAYSEHPGTRETAARERLWQDYIAATNALKAYQAGHGQIH